jgi:hypothetical protein
VNWTEITGVDASRHLVLRRVTGTTDGGLVMNITGKGMRTILLVIVLLVLVGALPTWPYSAGWGYYPSGGIGLVLIVLIFLAVMGII